MRVRTSAGVRATDFYGHFYMTNATDVELGSVGKYNSIHKQTNFSKKTNRHFTKFINFIEISLNPKKKNIEISLKCSKKFDLLQEFHQHFFGNAKFHQNFH